MGRNKQRTDHAMPQFNTKLRQWIPNKKQAKQILGLSHLSDNAFWRILRCEEATPEEVDLVQSAITNYGKQHNLPGWKELAEDV